MMITERFSPSYMSSGSSKRFNLMDKTSAEMNRDKKKAASPHIASKPRNLKTVLLRNHHGIIPKVRIRKKLDEDGRIKSVKIFRSMTSSEVKAAVLSAFSDLAVDQFKYLKALQNNHLQFVDNQEQNGDSLIGFCGGGSLYIVEVQYFISLCDLHTAIKVVCEYCMCFCMS